MAEDVYGGAEGGAWVGDGAYRHTLSLLNAYMYMVLMIGDCGVCRPFKLNEEQFNECSFRCGRVLHEAKEVETQ